MLYKQKENPVLTKELFQNPGCEYRGTPFWAWNCRVTEEDTDRILEDLKSMGMGGSHLHSRTGMDIPYLSDAFMKQIRYANQKAKELGMLTWLYDEDRFPSGAAGGLVTKERALRQKYLVFSPEPLEENRDRCLLARYEVILEQGCLKEYRMLEEGTSERRRAENGRIWYLYREIAGDNPWFNNQAYVDTLNPKAIDRFLEITHEAYFRALGEEFGKSVPAIFTDEPQFSSKNTLGFAGEETRMTLPWTDDFALTYREAYGTDFFAGFPECVWELPNGKASAARYRYHDHLCDRFVRAFADRIGAWCRAHGILLTGHLMQEPTLESQTGSVGEAMRSYRSFDIPGIDMLYDSRELNTAKQAQSAVRQYGREGMLSELYGVTGWEFDFRGHKLAGDWQAALGVTVRVHHLTWTSMAGEAKRDYPASIGYQSPWYREYPLIEDYFARLNTALTRGIPVVKVAVIHPIESYWLYWGTREQTQEKREEMDRNFRELTEWLLLGQIDFDFISEALWPELTPDEKLLEAGERAAETERAADRERAAETERAAVRERAAETERAADRERAAKTERVAGRGQMPADGTSAFMVGKMMYDTILVPNCVTLRRSTLKRLEAFKKSGGRVIFAGEIPRLTDAKESGEAAELAKKCERIPFSKCGVLEALQTDRVVDVRDSRGARAENLLYQMRRDGNRIWLFLAHCYPMKNPDLPRREELRIEVKGYYRPTLYDAMTGEIREVSCTHKDGRTRILETVYDHDSLLYALDEAPAPDRREERSTAEASARIQREERSPAEASAQNRLEEGALPEKEASAPVQTAKDSGIKLPDYVPFCLEEPNVCVLDMAKSSLDGMEWEAPEEILRIDNAYRKKLGYPLRQEAFPQPWLMPEEDCGSHRISLRFTIRSEISIDHPVLALEQAAQTRLTLNGEAVSPEITGYYVDRSIQTVALPGLRAGENILIAEMPYHPRFHLEAMYLLGDFGVRAEGKNLCLTGQRRELAFGDFCVQGLPFYGGNLRYQIPLNVERDGDLEISAPQFRCPLIQVLLDGEIQGRIAFSPYTLKIRNVKAGRHVLELKAYGNRYNTFGALHNCNHTFAWKGHPDSYRTEGAEWAYEYQLHPQGILTTPKITVRGTVPITRRTQI